MKLLPKNTCKCVYAKYEWMHVSKHVKINDSKYFLFSCFSSNKISTVPEVIIVNEFFEPLFDTFYEAASTIQLNCVVKYITMLYSVVSWTHNGRLLNDDIIRGGIRYIYLFLIKIIFCTQT